MDINVLTGIVVDICIKIHLKIGPGCFERVYEELLYYELTKQGINKCQEANIATN
ncbi:GxxExxY protein [Terrimonas pollutisoli]|uniref:GxxExxY protein n=1 Tax=Terrimonas pollutisoli TaxID=3034147 RepID=UPI0034DF46CF